MCDQKAVRAANSGWPYALDQTATSAARLTSHDDLHDLPWFGLHEGCSATAISSPPRLTGEEKRRELSTISVYTCTRWFIVIASRPLRYARCFVDCRAIKFAGGR